nr:unnamed protein product [Callosobruchus chinensis]
MNQDSNEKDFCEVFLLYVKTNRYHISHIWGASASTTLSIHDAVQRRAIRLTVDPALTCRLQPLSHRRSVVQRRAIRLIGDPALTCHLQLLSHRRGVL